MRKTLASMFIACCLPTALFMQAQTNQTTIKKETMEITESWDKVFPKSDKVNHSKITFVNRYGITLVADLYQPINASGRMPAIAVSGPFGAVKEQCSGLYAQKMAERGYLTIAFDPSFTGESGGTPRYVASPDINTEDFSAAVDYLLTRDDVDSERIGIIGICGWGGFAINAAAMDTRIKATVASTMYDMSRVNANGYYDRVKDAVWAALDEEEFSRIRLEELARRFTVCPFELGLDLSLWCDAIIGDYNYLFDPTVCLHRFFDSKGDYLFLVDEAHNLVERARDMYSASLQKSAFLD